MTWLDQLPKCVLSESHEISTNGGEELFKIVAGAVFIGIAVPVAAQPAMQFRELPKEVQEKALEVRKSCKEADSDRKFNDMQGIQILSLKDDGARDIVVDSEDLCGAHLAGYNCSNRGCDMDIYKEISSGLWRRVFHEHLYAKFLAIDWERMRIQLIVTSIYAGDPRCQPNPRRQYSSGMSCNVIATYRNDQWNWQPIK